MDGELSQDAQAILLLTAPLFVGRSRGSVNPLALGAYNKVARHLHDADMRPAALLDSEGRRELGQSWPELGTRRNLEDVHRLLDRGFLLVQALEHWHTHAIWVVTRADEEYPRRLKRMRGKAPPVLYGCGERDHLDGGGLAVVGSRKVSEELIAYTESVGQLAAQADVSIVSGGARGVDQAAMRGSLEAGGHAIGVLGNGLERAALNRENREPLMDGRLTLVSAYDPAARFRAWQAMDRNKQIYALADAALVVNTDHGHGGTWAGATEQLRKFRYAPVYVRQTEETPRKGLDALKAMGARAWPEPKDPPDLRALLVEDESTVLKPDPETDDSPLAEAAPDAVQIDIFSSESEADSDVLAVREGAPTEPQPTPPADGPVPGQLPMRLLHAMSGEMTRKEILAALGLKSRGNLKRRYLDPCLAEGWIEVTMPERPSSPHQRFRITPVGSAHKEALKDA